MYPLKGVHGPPQIRPFSYTFIYFLTIFSASCPLNIYRYQLFFIFLIFIMALSRPSGMFRSLFDLLTIFHFSMCKKVPKKALFWPFQAFIYTLKSENYKILQLRNETQLNAKMRCLCNEKKYKRSYLYEYVSVKMRKKTPITGYFVFRLRPEIAATEFLPLYMGDG